MGSKPSLKSEQRLHLLDAYRARGHRNNSLWVVYSPKMNTDWLLPSDRQLVHWAIFLEINPEVKSFDLRPERVISHDEQEARGTELDAVVELSNGKTEWHEVKSTEIEISIAHSQLLAQSAAAAEQGISYRIFSDKELSPYTQIACRWLKAIAFAAAIRGQSQTPTLIALIGRLRDRSDGVVGELLADLVDYDEPVVMGLLVRYAIQGHISLNLTKEPFGRFTRWSWNHRV